MTGARTASEGPSRPPATNPAEAGLCPFPPPGAALVLPRFAHPHDEPSRGLRLLLHTKELRLRGSLLPNDF